MIKLLLATDPGQYWVTINIGNCSLRDTAQVSLVDATTSMQSVLCPGETLLVGTETFDAQHPSGQVVFPNMASSACDSIVNNSLTFLTASQSNVYQNNCDPAAVGVDTVFLTSTVLPSPNGRQRATCAVQLAQPPLLQHRKQERIP